MVNQLATGGVTSHFRFDRRWLAIFERMEPTHAGNTKYVAVVTSIDLQSSRTRRPER
jgi:hypothetical protein